LATNGWCVTRPPGGMQISNDISASRTGAPRIRRFFFVSVEFPTKARRKRRMISAKTESANLQPQCRIHSGEKFNIINVLYHALRHRAPACADRQETADAIFWCKRPPELIFSIAECGGQRWRAKAIAGLYQLGAIKMNVTALKGLSRLMWTCSDGVDGLKSPSGDLPSTRPRRNAQLPSSINRPAAPRQAGAVDDNRRAVGGELAAHSHTGAFWTSAPCTYASALVHLLPFAGAFRRPAAMLAA
jgi:hypothetical protein